MSVDVDVAIETIKNALEDYCKQCITALETAEALYKEAFANAFNAIDDFKNEYSISDCIDYGEPIDDQPSGLEDGE